MEKRSVLKSLLSYLPVYATSALLFQAMYAIKGAWVGQTFALASSNDSVGKKSRIRRSKAERKTMVETFINK